MKEFSSIEGINEEPLDIILTTLIEKSSESNIRYIITERQLVLGLSSLLANPNSNVLKNVVKIIELICTIIEDIRSKINEKRSKYLKSLTILSECPVHQKN